MRITRRLTTVSALAATLFVAAPAAEADAQAPSDVLTPVVQALPHTPALPIPSVQIPPLPGNPTVPISPPYVPGLLGSLP